MKKASKAALTVLVIGLLYSTIMATNAKVKEARCLSLAQQYIIHDLQRSIRENTEGPGEELAAEWADIAVYCDLIRDQERTIASLKRELEELKAGIHE